MDKRGKHEKRVTVAVFPGTFDPIHNGHISMVKRGLDIFDRVVVGVARHTTKAPLFDLEERVELAREVFKGEDRVTVDGFLGLTVDYARRIEAQVILRGLRAVSDFDYEFQMALMNRRLDRDVQTVFLMTDYKWMFLSSTIMKEAAKHGGNIKGLAPDHIVSTVYQRFAALGRHG